MHIFLPGYQEWFCLAEASTGFSIIVLYKHNHISNMLSNLCFEDICGNNRMNQGVHLLLRKALLELIQLVRVHWKPNAKFMQ